MAAATVAAAGLIGVGVVGVTQLASADDSDASTVEPSQLAAVGAATETAATDDATNDDRPNDSTNDGGPGAPSIDGEIVIDLGDGDPVTIDLGDLDAEALEAFRECVGIPDIVDGLPGELGDLDFGQIDELLGDFDVDVQEWLDGLDQLELPDIADRFDGDLFMAPDGTHITVLGPDGAQIIDLGDGDASVTITQSDGELQITTDGDASVSEPSDLFSDFMDGFPELDGDIDLPGLLEDFDLENLPFDLDSLPDLGELELPAIDLPSAEQIQSCLDQLN